MYSIYHQRGKTSPFHMIGVDFTHFNICCTFNKAILLASYIGCAQIYKRYNTVQAANLAGFRASEDPRFEAGIPDFMNGILNFSIHFNVVHRKVDWRNPKMKSLNSMPAVIPVSLIDVVLGKASCGR